MISINNEEIPEHISYSSLMDYLSCGWLYYLSRIKKVKETPAWWLYGGIAVHRATEVWDNKMWGHQNESG
jgi:hypothetical protein